jgi:putative spermidine/putrescine transport system ATP-binding protein
MPAAVAMIRPETIGVTAVEAAPLSGIVDSVSFIGDRQRLVVSGASRGLLTVDAPNTVQVRPGERIGLSIPPDAVRLLQPES